MYSAFGTYHNKRNNPNNVYQSLDQDIKNVTNHSFNKEHFTNFDNKNQYIQSNKRFNNKIFEHFNDVSSSIQSIIGIGTDKNLYIKDNLTKPWTKVPNSGDVKSVFQLNDYTFVGVGMDNKLWTRSDINANWNQVPNSGDVIHIIQLKDNTFLGIGTNLFLYTKATLTAPWVQIPNSCCVTNIIQLNDKSFVGIGTDKKLWTKATLTSGWSQVPNSGDVISIVQLPDNTFVGIGTDNFLWTKSSLTSPWSQIPASCCVTNITNISKRPESTQTVSASASTSASTVPLVTFYSGYNYSGVANSLDIGEYSYAKMLASRIANDSISSIKIPNGYTVIVYQDDIGSLSTTLTSDVPDLRTVTVNGRSFDKTISAFKISGSPTSPNVSIQGSQGIQGVSSQVATPSNPNTNVSVSSQFATQSNPIVGVASQVATPSKPDVVVGTLSSQNVGVATLSKPDIVVGTLSSQNVGVATSSVGVPIGLSPVNYNASPYGSSKISQDFYTQSKVVFGTNNYYPVGMNIDGSVFTNGNILVKGDHIVSGNGRINSFQIDNQLCIDDVCIDRVLLSNMIANTGKPLPRNFTVFR